MEFSALELIKSNSDPSKKPRIEEEAPFVPFIDFLKPAASEPRSRRDETPRAAPERERPEPVRQAREDAPSDARHREADRTHAERPAAKAEDAATDPARVADAGKPSETPDSPGPDSSKKLAAGKDGAATSGAATPGTAKGTANPGAAHSKEPSFAGTHPMPTAFQPDGEHGTPAQHAPAQHANGAHANAAPGAGPAHPTTAPLLAAPETIEGKGTGTEVLRGLLARQRATGASGDALDPRLATANGALRPDADTGIKTKGSRAFSPVKGESANAAFPTASGGNTTTSQPQVMQTMNAAQPASLAGAATPDAGAALPKADPAVPSTGMVASPVSEAPGLSPLNPGETSAIRAATLATIQGRAPAQAAAPLPTDQVAVHLKQAADGGMDRIRIQLKPAALGHIDVKMEVAKDGKVMAVLSIERPETFELLQRDARTLERALQDSGLRADSNSLNFQLRGQGNGQTGDGQSAGAHANGEEHPRNGQLTDEEMPPMESYDFSTIGDGIVDIRV